MGLDKNWWSVCCLIVDLESFLSSLMVTDGVTLEGVGLDVLVSIEV
jgi:hypothetical protein